MDFSKSALMAVLSEASYADFRAAEQPDGSYRESDVETALTTSGLSPTQAAEFITQWRVVSHQPNTGNGFSATVFESIEHPGEFVFAMRGTEPTAQWGTDITLADIADIGADGIALNQAIDLINYYQQLTTDDTDLAVQYEPYEGVIPPPPGTTEYQVSFLLGVPFYRYIKIADPVKGLGIIPDTAGTIDIAGHSLGGHLALILSRFDPNRVDDVHTYNAPGFDTGIIGSDDTEWFFRAMAEAETNETGTTTVGSFPISRIYNLVVPEDLVSDIGELPAGTTTLFSEVDTTTAAHKALSAHSSINITDSLAIHDLFAQLAPGIDLNTMSEILQAASATAKNSLETTLAAVGTLFGEQFQSTETTRDTLYQHIDKLTDTNPLFNQAIGLVSIESLTDKTVSELTGLASSGLAYRYALVNGNPFALTGDDSLYAQHNAAGELELYDPQSDKGSLTSIYLNDRAAFLATKIQFNTTDNSVKGPETLEYHDLASDTLVTVTATTAGASKRIVFGSDGNDTLNQGGDKEDHLYGGKGDDLLEGKGGADYLEGGKGHDTYRAGDDDTLLDIDGNGRVLFEGRPLNGGHRQDDGSYRSTDGIFTYQLANDILTVTDGSNTLAINDFTAGDLGITLDEASPEPGEQTLTISGDLQWKDFDPDQPGIQVHYDALGNKINDPADIEVPDQVDELYDSTGNDLIQTGGGEDVISAWRGGDDRIEAGSGRDKVYAGDGDDLIEGGADTDILASDTGQTTLTRDWLSGGAADNSLAEAA